MATFQWLSVKYYKLFILNLLIEILEFINDYCIKMISIIIIYFKINIKSRIFLTQDSRVQQNYLKDHLLNKNTHEFK